MSDRTVGLAGQQFNIFIRNFHHDFFATLPINGIEAPRQLVLELLPLEGQVAVQQARKGEEREDGVGKWSVIHRRNRD